MTEEQSYTFGRSSSVLVPNRCITHLWFQIAVLMQLEGKRDEGNRLVQASIITDLSALLHVNNNTQ